VSAADRSPLEDALVSILGTSIDNRSSTDGRFVLGIGRFTEDDVMTVDGKTVYRGPNGNGVFELRVSRDGYQVGTLPLENLGEGELRDLEQDIELITP
jgi:hypothetical protein